MAYIFNRKTRKMEHAKCRHCALFDWSQKQSWTGYCNYKRCKVSNSTLGCSAFQYKFSYLDPSRVDVQLNLFNYEKSV